MNVLNYVKKLTWDFHSNRRIDTLHPAIRQKVITFINTIQKEHGITLRVTSALRTWEEQTKLYNQGRTTPGKVVTDAEAGESYHNYGLGFDVVEIKNGKALWKNDNWPLIGKVGTQFGFAWGGYWKKPDRPHFEKRFGLHHTQMAARYRSGQRKGHYITIT